MMSLLFTNSPFTASDTSNDPPSYSPFGLVNQTSIFTTISHKVDPEVPALVTFAVLVSIVNQLLAPNTVYCSLFSILLLTFLILIQSKYRSLLIIIYLNGLFVSFIGIGNCIGDIIVLEELTNKSDTNNDTIAFITWLFSLQISGALNQIILHTILITIGTLIAFVGIMIRMEDGFASNVFKLDCGFSWEEIREMEELKLNEMV